MALLGISAQQIRTATPGPVTPGAAAAEGSSVALARADHTHAVPVATPGAITPGASAAEGVANSFSRSDHEHQIVTSVAKDLALGVASSEGVASSFARSDHVHRADAIFRSAIQRPCFAFIRAVLLSSTPTVVGCITNAYSGTLSASGSNTNAFSSRFGRVLVTSTAAINQNCGYGMSNLNMFRGGGWSFYASQLFIPYLSSGKTNYRMMAFLNSGGAPSATAEPSVLANSLSFLLDSTDTNWNLCGGGTVRKYDTGIPRPVLTGDPTNGDNDVLLAEFLGDPDGSVTCTLQRLNPTRPATYSRKLLDSEINTSVASVMPGIYMNTGPTSSTAAGYAFSSLYAEAWL